MQLEDYFDFLQPNDIRIKGHRVGIEHVLYEHIYRSQTPEEIAKIFDTLTMEQIYATILYYLHNKQEVSRYLTDWLEYSRESREENLRQHAGWYERMGRFKAEGKARERQQVEK
jgi:uncharacterized protein (DUF433 family)